MAGADQHRSVTRQRARRRLAALVGSVTATIAIAAAALVVQVGSASGDVDAGDSALSSARLTLLDQPVQDGVASDGSDATSTAAADRQDTSLPARSGHGTRIVFSESRQRVWLVRDGKVGRTYLVSGSKHENLDPGTYAVQARFERTTAYDYSGTMRWFVQFTTGDTAAIGFHSVPRDNDGRLEQTKAQLGTPLSSGCIRQWADDAKALWDFAPVGTTVVVTA